MPAVANNASSIDYAIAQFNSVMNVTSEKIQEILRDQTIRLYETVTNPPKYSAATRSTTDHNIFTRSEKRGILISADEAEHSIILNNDGKLYRFKIIYAKIQGYGVSFPDLSTIKEVNAGDYVRYGKTALDIIKQTYQNNAQGGK